MNWYIPDLQPYFQYFYTEITRWMLANPLPIAVITNILTGLKAWAIKSNKATDDKIVTLLLSFFRLKWLDDLTTIKSNKNGVG